MQDSTVRQITSNFSESQQDQHDCDSIQCHKDPKQHGTTLVYGFAGSVVPTCTGIFSSERVRSSALRAA